MFLMMSASGFPCIEGDFPSPVHFWEEERKQAESDMGLGLQVSYPVVQFEETSSHDPPVV